LLPYLEQDNLFKLYDMRFPFLSSPSIVPGTPDNQAVIRTPLQTFLCPAAPRDRSMLCSRTYKFGSFTALFSAAPSDYAPSSSINQGSISFFGYPNGTSQIQVQSALRPWFKGSGLGLIGFPAQEPNTIVAITDGTSNTILMCEDAGRPLRYVKG